MTPLATPRLESHLGVAGTCTLFFKREVLVLKNRVPRVASLPPRKEPRVLVLVFYGFGPEDPETLRAD
jgi:hypothetical protein